MTLQELLRSHSKQIIDSISHLKSSIEKLRNERNAALERIRQSRLHVSSKLSDSESISNATRLIEEQIFENEQHLQKIREELESKREKLIEFQKIHSEITTQISSQKMAEVSDLETAEKREEEIIQTEEVLQRESLKLNESRKTAFNFYLEHLWKRIIEHSISDEQRKVSVQVRQRFEVERHQDPHLASLWEAREEWRKIVASLAPKLVLETAKNELKKVENEIESRFPNIFETSASDRNFNEIEELFFLQGESGNAILLPLPVPVLVWENIKNGHSNLTEEVAMKLVWSIAKAIQGKQDSSEFTKSHNMIWLESEALREIIANGESLVLSLPSGGRVDFIMSPLPSELYEVFRNED